MPKLTIPPELAALFDQAVLLQQADEGESGFARLNKMLGPDQARLVADQSPQIAACTGRRAGKTTAVIGKVGQVFDKHPDNGACAYFAPSDEQGVAIIWEDILAYNRQFELGLVEHWSDRYWSRGGSNLEVIGFNSRRDSERARGRKFHLVAVDEAQLGPPWFTSFIDSAVAPTTLDYLGQIVLTGTPGEAAVGYFHDAYHAIDDSWSNDYHWTCAQNPFFAGRDPLAEVRQRHKLAIDSITYRREWLGEWIVDPDALVYYIPDEAVRPAGADAQWYYTFYGLDLGWRDHDAIAVVSVDIRRGFSHLRHIETKGQQTNHQLFARILELQGVFGAGPVVYDPAGHATKKTIETFAGDAPDIQWIQAEKASKVEYIQLLNDDLRSGRTFVETDSPMIKEARRLRWKRPGKVAEDADHSDPGDAWLYSYRAARDLIRELPAEEDRSNDNPYKRWERKMRERQNQVGMSSYAAQRRREIS